MITHFGIILLDETEIIFRIYVTSDTEWSLFHYHNSLLYSFEANVILDIIGNFFTTEIAQHIAEWKICSRHQQKKVLRKISQLLSMPIEDISLAREQELISKGMFTELW